MGNTLLHFHQGKSDKEKDEMGVQLLATFLKEFNKNITYEDVHSDLLHQWDELSELRKITCKEYPVEESLNRFLEKYGVSLDVDACKKAMDIFYTEYRNEVCIEEGLHNTLSQIKKKGYKMAVISNSWLYDEVMIHCFQKTGIHDLIDSYTFSYYLREGKPKRSIFIEALNKMHTTGEDSIMVGDNLISDIQPAQELGFMGIWYNEHGKINDSSIQPKLEICELKELLTKL